MYRHWYPPDVAASGFGSSNDLDAPLIVAVTRFRLAKYHVLYVRNACLTSVRRTFGNWNVFVGTSYPRFMLPFDSFWRASGTSYDRSGACTGPSKPIACQWYVIVSVEL